MGSVYLATQHGAAGFRRVVAVKRAFPQLLEDPSFRKLMASEVRLSALVRHPNVVEVSDVEEAEGELSLVMEYIEGGSLAELVKHPEGLPPAIGMRIVLDAAAGLEAVHECTDESGCPLSLVHRDISPQNILVGIDGLARIADFGIAQVHDPSASTISGLLRGKPGYMAPEYVETSIATPACDVFALAILTWELLTRRRLFRSGSDIETLDRVRATVVPRPSSFVDGIPPALDDVVMRALSRRPEDRYPSSRAFADALETALRGTTLLATHGAVGSFVRMVTGAALSERRILINQPTSTSTLPSIATCAPETPVVIANGSRSTRAEGLRAAPSTSRHAFWGAVAAMMIATTIGATSLRIKQRWSSVTPNVVVPDVVVPPSAPHVVAPPPSAVVVEPVAAPTAAVAVAAPVESTPAVVPPPPPRAARPARPRDGGAVTLAVALSAEAAEAVGPAPPTPKESLVTAPLRKAPENPYLP